jgi:uncharacterized tellurite resistance protein B-like protein
MRDAKRSARIFSSTSSREISNPPGEPRSGRVRLGVMSVWKWLGLGRGADRPEFDSLEEIEAALTGLAPARRRYVACFTYILTRGARADPQVTDAETREMERLVADRVGIPADRAADAVRLSAIQARRSGGTDDFVVTREFNAVASHAQKLALVDALFAVSGVDASIITIEDNEIRRIANELKIEHAEYIALRSKHLENLEVLRGRTRRAD